MQKYKVEKIELDNMIYFAVQCPFLKGHKIAHFINKVLNIELKKDFDFESYATEKAQYHIYYVDFNEHDQCSYHLVQNNAPKPLFHNQQAVDFWLLVEFLDGLNEARVRPIRQSVLKNLQLIEQVFSVDEVNPLKLGGYEDFVIDMSTHFSNRLRARQDREREEGRKRRLNRV